jgi:hypothetical protein
MYPKLTTHAATRLRQRGIPLLRSIASSTSGMCDTIITVPRSCSWTIAAGGLHGARWARLCTSGRSG